MMSFFFMTAMVVNSAGSHIAKVLFSADDIKRRVGAVGRKLALDYADRKPLVMGTLTGAFIFTADLVRAMEPCPLDMDVTFCQASSYGSGTQSSGNVKLNTCSHIPVKNRNVILVEDIVDTGGTLSTLMKALLGAGAESVECVALLNKAEGRTVDVEAKYVCFQCPNEFVVGYGLDFDQHYRCLPYVGVLKPEVYNNYERGE
ncbi:hypothetical protein BSKO_10564 [Bryopsis sp. KO-2023]|nr:hypothetical protein BSKO_10564 [Bryopsis sp. KO-2023]